MRAVTEGKIPKGGNPVDGITKVNVLTKVDSNVFEKSIQLKGICLNDNVGLVTAYANDISYDEVFAGQLKFYLQFY